MGLKSILGPLQSLTRFQNVEHLLFSVLKQPLQFIITPQVNRNRPQVFRKTQGLQFEQWLNLTTARLDWGTNSRRIGQLAFFCILCCSSSASTPHFPAPGLRQRWYCRESQNDMLKLQPCLCKKIRLSLNILRTRRDLIVRKRKAGSVSVPASGAN